MKPNDNIKKNIKTLEQLHIHDTGIFHYSNNIVEPLTNRSNSRLERASQKPLHAREPDVAFFILRGKAGGSK